MFLDAKFVPTSFEYRSSMATAKLATATSLPAVTSQHEVEVRAKQILESHPHFRGRAHLVVVRFSAGKLQLDGRLPTHYLKQLAQEALRELQDIVRLENLIVVCDPRGVQSTVDRWIRDNSVEIPDEGVTGGSAPKPR